MSTIREQLKTTFLGLAGLLSKMNDMQGEVESAKQEILSAIGNIPEPDLSAVSKESTLTQGVQDIREDISHIQIDTSDLAKQGTNTSISLTTMDSKLGNYVLIQDEEYQYALLDLISRLD